MMRLAYRYFASLCLLLLLSTAAAEPLHSHPNQSGPSACSLCVVAHTTAPTAASSSAKPVLIALDFIQAEEVRVPTHLEAFDLSIRGPPAL